MQSRSKGNAQGIDVSHHQGVINWGKVAASGISFAFIKATQNSMDPQFLVNVKNAKAAGLLVGAYHYLDDKVTTADMARAAAQTFYRAIVAAGGGDIFDLPFVLDYESNKNKLSPQTITAIAKAFMEEIQRYTGRLPMLYTYPAFIGNFAGLTQYPLWIARYADQAPADGSGWKRWDFWQYSDGTVGGVLPTGVRSVSGIAGPVDLNEFDGTVEQLKAKYGKKAKEETKVQERDKSKVSDWAAEAWDTMTNNGYVDGTRPGDTMTREEGLVIAYRLRTNLLKLIAGNTQDIKALDARMQQIEQNGLSNSKY